MRSTMQVCTQVCGNVASIASGKPLRPSTQAIRTSSTPRRRRSLRTASQNLELGVLPPDPEHLAVAVAGDPEGEIAGPGAHRAVFSDLDEHRVEVDDRIDALQRAAAPGGDVLEHRVGDGRDRVAADLGAVELADVGAD